MAVPGRPHGAQDVDRVRGVLVLAAVVPAGEAREVVGQRGSDRHALVPAAALDLDRERHRLLEDLVVRVAHADPVPRGDLRSFGSDRSATFPPRRPTYRRRLLPVGVREPAESERVGEPPGRPERAEDGRSAIDVGLGEPDDLRGAVCHRLREPNNARPLPPPAEPG